MRFGPVESLVSSRIDSVEYVFGKSGGKPRFCIDRRHYQQRQWRKLNYRTVSGSDRILRSTCEGQHPQKAFRVNVECQHPVATAHGSVVEWWHPVSTHVSEQVSMMSPVYIEGGISTPQSCPTGDPALPSLFSPVSYFVGSSTIVSFIAFATAASLKGNSRGVTARQSAS